MEGGVRVCVKGECSMWCVLNRISGVCVCVEGGEGMRGGLRVCEAGAGCGVCTTGYQGGCVCVKGRCRVWCVLNRAGVCVAQCACAVNHAYSTMRTATESWQSLLLTGLDPALPSPPSPALPPSPRPPSLASLPPSLLPLPALPLLLTHLSCAEGTYGIVFRARCKSSGKIYALKKLKMEHCPDGFPQTSVREVNVLLSLHHPNIVNVAEVRGGACGCEGGLFCGRKGEACGCVCGCFGDEGGACGGEVGGGVF